MNYDEFAFFNQQLGAMLRQNIPLEGALRQLCIGLRDPKLRGEIQELESDLARGTPLVEALKRRDVPEFYRRMVEIGARGNDLPGILTMLADHYHRVNAAWARLKGLMVYPVIVVLVSLGLTAMLTVVFSHFLTTVGDVLTPSRVWWTGVWIPPLVLAALALIGVAALTFRSWRERLRWRLPAFREASLAQLASAIALMLRNGTPLADALALAQGLESRSPAAPVLAKWKAMVEVGQGKPAQWAHPSGPFPPLFAWLIQKGGEDPAAGFQKASDLYQNRATYRIELALYGALPISILFLGLLVFWQILPFMQVMIQMMRALGSSGE